MTITPNPAGPVTPSPTGTTTLAVKTKPKLFPALAYKTPESQQPIEPPTGTQERFSISSEESDMPQCIIWWKKWWCPVFCEFLGALQLTFLVYLSRIENRFKMIQTPDAYIVTLGSIVFMNVQSFGRRSGGFGNPAVAFAAYVAGRIDWRLTIAFATAETLGSCAGLGMIGLLHPPGRKTKWLDCRQLDQHTTLALMTGEILQTIVMALFGCSVWRPRRANQSVPPPPKYPTPPNDALLSIKFGMMIAGICFTSGWIRNHGGGANPAMALAAAIDGGCFSSLWIFWVGPVVGCCLGAAFYRYILVPIPRGRVRSFIFT